MLKQTGVKIQKIKLSSEHKQLKEGLYQLFIFIKNKTKGNGLKLQKGRIQSIPKEKSLPSEGLLEPGNWDPFPGDNQNELE